MGRKLLFLILLSLFFLNPISGFGQDCPGENESTSISISTSDATTFCEGEEITFNADIINGGSNPDIEWKIDGNTVTGVTSTSFSTTSLTNNNKVSASVTSDCEPQTTDNSNSITVTVNDLRTLTVSVSSSDNTICQGEEVTFTASNTNGGSNPSYEWFIGATSQGTTSNNTFSTSGLNNNDEVSVKMTSNASCAEPNPVSSSPVQITVNNLITPSVIISASDTEICHNEEVVFTVNPTNGGSNPSYQWLVNGSNVGTNNNTFSSSGLNNLDEVTVVMTSNITCVNPDVNPATSNEIIMQVNPLKTPEVSIEVSDNTICQEKTTTFTATPTNGGSNPTYQWKVNNTNVGAITSTNTFSPSNLNNNDIVSVVMTSDIDCVDLEANPATSNEISITVNPILNPEVTIEASETFICSGTQVNFTATPVDAGNNPNYEWFIDEASQGTPSSNNSFSTSNLTDSQEVWVKIIPTDDCAEPTTANSNKIPMEVLSDVPAPPATITGPIAICPVANLVYEVENDPSVGKYIWDFPAGWTITSGKDTHRVEVTAGNNSDTGNFNISVKAENICGESTNSQLEVSVDDFVETQAGEDQTLCKDQESINLEGYVQFGNPGQTNKLEPLWSTPNGSGSFGATSQLNTTYTFSETDKSNGQVTLVLTTDEPRGACQAGEDEMIIYFYEDATATIETADITICEGETVDLTGVVGGSNAVASWSSSGGGFSDATSLTPTFTPTTTGVIDVVLNSNAECSSSTTDTVQITVNPLPVVEAGQDITICSNTPAAITATIEGSATTGEWTTNGTGSFDNASLENTRYNPSTEDITAGNVTLTFTTTNQAESCESASDSLKLIIEPEVVVEAGEGFTICSDGTATLSATISGGTTMGTWSSDTGGTFENANSLNSIYTPSEADISAGNVILKFTSSEPSGECEAKSDEITITINPVVEIEAGDDLNVCSSGTVALAGASIGGGATTAAWKIISGGGTLSSTALTENPEIVEYTASSNFSGEVLLRLTSEDADGPCGVVYDDVTINVQEEIVITTQPENIGVCSTEPTTLSVVANGDDLQYQWYKDGNAISGANDAELSFSNTTSANAGSYYVEVSGGTESCESVASEPATINVDEDIIILEPATDESVCGDGSTEATFRFVAHANGSPLTFTWLKDGAEVDDSDTDISIVTSEIDNSGEYEGTLTISNISDQENHNGDYNVQINGPDNFTCPTAISNTFYLRVNEVPKLPEVAEIVYCQFDTAEPLTVINGTNLTWYASETGDDAFSEVPVPNTDEPGETIYWVTQTPDVCESERIAVYVTIKEKPASPETTTRIEYCEGETANALEALADGEAKLNWYDAEENQLSGAPLPNTESAGTFLYYVSQILDNCESDKVAIEVIIHELPEVVITSSETLICAASQVSLTAEGADSFTWYNEADEEIGTTAVLELNPETTTTYKVIGIGTGNCSSEATITIEVDQPSNAGTISGASNVCIGNNTGEVSVTDINGKVIRWEFSENNGETWETIPQEESEISTTYTYENLIATTSFRAVVQNGICEEAISEAVSIQVDEYPIGGELNFEGFDRIFTICENVDSNYAVPLQLSNNIGAVVAWKYRASSATSWSTVMDNGDNYTGSTLSANQIEAINMNETTIFRVEIEGGACTTNIVSETAIISVIPSDIKPTPVEVDPEIVCIGEEVTLSSGTGYENSTDFSGGAFDNSSITNHGWRITDQHGNIEFNFNSSANNTRPEKWLRTNPQSFITANINTNVVSEQEWSSGATENKGFAIVSGNNPSTLETPIFTLSPTDQAILSFDQAYNLTEGAEIRVEISTNGGNSYDGEINPLYQKTGPLSSGSYGSFGTSTHPNNNISIDLGNYMGQGNLRIRFKYIGVRDGDIWTLDNIDLPDAPRTIEMEWRDYSNPDKPEGEIIGYDASEVWEPKQIGWNNFEVKTRLIFNSEGEACEVAENSETIEVFVFDTYTVTTTAIAGSCGNNSAKLSASVTGSLLGEIENYPTPDGYIGEWQIEGPAGYELANLDTSVTIDPVNNPDVIFTAEESGSYTFAWVLTPTEVDENGDLISNENCEITYNNASVEILDCTTLDFDGLDDYVDLGKDYPGDYSIEAWIRPEASTGTIISGPNFEINLEDLPGEINPNSRWYHIAVSNNALYVDGIESGNFNLGNSGEKTLIGARWNNEIQEAENHFSGWIEEVRIWNTAISEDQIRFMMNQRLINNGTQMGVEIPMDVPGGLSFESLAGYYQLLAAPELVALGTTPDLANISVPGRLVNMETLQENTAPLPYTSRIDGQTWATGDTWTHFDVWDAPNSKGINGKLINWNIVRASHNIDSGNKDIIVLGLKSESGTLDIFNPSGTHNETNSGQYLRISHYLKLDGIIDLTGESQLIQDVGSIVDVASAGYLERDQQGTANSYNYNYWSFPVSEGTSNSGGSIKNLLKDGTNSNNPGEILFNRDHTYADNYNNAGQKRISSYWLFKFFGTANVYAEWKWVGENGLLNTGDGFTMKGTSGDVAISTPQNYVFRGVPNNGPVTGVSIGKDQNRLIGNPYPSAIDAIQFIKDNLKDNGNNSENIFNGALYFWDHFGAENTHILREYIGGYATINLSGSVQSASSVDERINNDGSTGSKKPGVFVPVGQGFFINTVLDPEIDNGITISGGTVNFNNNQRAFVTESNSEESQFLKPIYPTKGKNKVTTKDSRYKIRLDFTSPLGFHRQILVTADANTTNGFDLGYDALLIDNIPEDMFWLIQDNEFVIQAVPNFNIDQVLPLGIKIKEAGEFRIELGDLENYPETQPVYLKDKLTDSIHDLRKSAYFEVSESGTHKDRFEIVFKNKENLEDPDKPSLTTTLDFGYNHNTRELRIENPDLIDISKVLVFDLGGRLIQTFTNIPKQKQHTINVNSMNTSVYIVKIITKDGNKDKKFIMK